MQLELLLDSLYLEGVIIIFFHEHLLSLLGRTWDGDAISVSFWTRVLSVIATSQHA